MAITWEAPLSPPTWVSATPIAGGSLVNGTTYYYKIAAVNGTAPGPSLGGLMNYTISGLSTEISATASGADLTIQLVWNAVTGADGYIIYRTTVSGNYYSNAARMKRLSDGSNGYTTVAAVSAGNDTGAYTLDAESILWAGSTSTITWDMAPTTYGIGRVLLSDGSATVYTLQDIETAVGGR